jgi:hypothetical protein
MKFYNQILSVLLFTSLVINIFRNNVQQSIFICLLIIINILLSNKKQ